MGRKTGIQQDGDDVLVLLLASIVHIVLVVVLGLAWPCGRVRGRGQSSKWAFSVLFGQTHDELNGQFIVATPVRARVR